MTKEQLLHIYFRGQLMTGDGIHHFPRCVMSAYRRGILDEQAQKTLGVNKAKRQIFKR